MRVNSKKLGAKESISEIQMGARKKNNGRGKKGRYLLMACHAPSIKTCLQQTKIEQ